MGLVLIRRPLYAFVLIILTHTQLRAQKEYVDIRDTVNDISFRLAPGRNIRMRTTADTAYAIYHLLRIGSRSLLAKKDGNEVADTIRFSQIQSVVLKQRGAFVKQFFILEGVGLIINSMLLYGVKKKDGDPTAAVGLLPFTIVILPLVGALCLDSYPPEAVSFNGKYKYTYHGK